ncbi:MAG: glycosyltransferase [Pseudomonadota bacterium]
MSDAKKIAIMSSAGGGGAGIAARRLTDAINENGPHSADFIDIAVLGEGLPLSVCVADSFSNHTISDTHFTVEKPGYVRGWLVDMLAEYDLINVNWASFLMSNSELLALAMRGRPMLFMMHDFYYITGGCHYPATCAQLGSGCLACPQVDTKRSSQSVIAENYQLKQAIFAQPNVHIAAPSGFLRDTAVQSGIIPSDRAHVLRNAYQPSHAFNSNRSFARRILLIADSLYEGRKNMRFALEVLAKLSQMGERFMVDVVGQAAPEMKAYLAATGVRHVFHGRITDHDELAAIMSQTNVMITASLEDNWPNILVEAGSYGCMPVVGPGHGCEEFVHEFDYGHVAKDYTVPSFLSATLNALNDQSPEKRQRAVESIRATHDPAAASASFASILDNIPVHEHSVTLLSQSAPVGRHKVHMES